MASMFVFGSFSYIKSYLLSCGQKRNMMELFCEPKAVMTGWVFWIASWVISVTRLFTVFCLSCHPLLPQHSKKLYTWPTARVPGLITQGGHLSPPKQPMMERPFQGHKGCETPNKRAVWTGTSTINTSGPLNEAMEHIHLPTDHKLKPPFM